MSGTLAVPSAGSSRTLIVKIWAKLPIKLG
ncbi:unnamed protein product, partial [Rotaria magnacalcarata]